MGPSSKTKKVFTLLAKTFYPLKNNYKLLDILLDQFRMNSCRMMIATTMPISTATAFIWC